MTGVAAKLDHVAVAAERWDELWPRYRTELGGDWVGGGPSVGFASAQLQYAGGMKVEVLMPTDWKRNDFLRRFLDHRGPGAHHMTFKVPDITAAIEASEAAGYRPVGVDLSDPGWKEAFLHPKDAPGVVIQLAESMGEWEEPTPAWLPHKAARTARLLYVGHFVHHFDDAVRLYGDLLSGEESPSGEDGMQFRWPGGGVIRVFERRDEPEGVHHLAFETDEPFALRAAKPLDDGRYEVAPEENLGVRLLLRGTT